MRLYKPMFLVCKYMRKDHTSSLKVLQSMSEFGWAWKHQNSPECTESFSLQNVEAGYYREEEAGHNREKEKGTTYSGQFLDVLIRSPKAGQTNLLRELSEGRVSKQRHMTKQLVAHIAAVTENLFCNIYKKKEEKKKMHITVKWFVIFQTPLLRTSVIFCIYTSKNDWDNGVSLKCIRNTHVKVLSCDYLLGPLH